MKETFDVLDPNTNIHKSMLIEASAGTGKTFTIENLFVRLLLESQDATIDNILVVTFTRAATQELCQRIHKKIVETISVLKQRGESTRKLSQALLAFDSAHIYTIHSFCMNMLTEMPLESNSGCDFMANDDPISTGILAKVVQDFFRTGLIRDHYSHRQLHIVLKHHRGDIKSLEKTLVRYLSINAHAQKPKRYLEYFEEFKDTLSPLKEKYSSQDIFEVLCAQAPKFKKTCTRNKEIREDVVDKIKVISALFDQRDMTHDDFNSFLEFSSEILELFSENNLKASSATDVIPQVIKDLEGCVSQAAKYSIILSSMVYDCQTILHHLLQKEEKFRYDDLVNTVYQALNNPKFVENVRNRFKMVIIDEFQDTDLMQWTIFKTLFLSHAHLYLVGDPKQAIYAFRQADIYTYLDAAESIDDVATLNVNYRSQGPLVDALNALFSKPQFMHLPRRNMWLDYDKVLASGTVSERIFSDELGSVHFCIAEGDQGRSLRWPTQEIEEGYFFPYIASEIIKLHQNDGVSYSDWAILVRDRYQAEAFSRFCKKYNIPTLTQREMSLHRSPVLQDLIDVMNGVIHSDDLNAIKIASLTPIFGDRESLVALCLLCNRLKKRLYHDGFSSFFHDLVAHVAEGILSQVEGNLYYHDLMQFSEVLIEYQNTTLASPEDLFNYLLEIRDEQDEDTAKKIRQDQTVDAVKILTTHMSKGLEFPIVVSLGLSKRTPAPPGKLHEDLIVDGSRRLIPITNKNDEEYEAFCRENDAEKMRQLYVAMTRAKHRLYVPVAISSSTKALKPGDASPFEIYLSLTDGEMTAFYSLIENHPSMSYTFIEEDIEVKKASHSDDPIVLEPPKEITIPGKQLYVRSFSSLATSTHGIDLAPPHDPHTDNKTSHTLPSGPETGLIIHEIFENIPFARYQSIKEVKPYVVPYIQGSFLEGWEDVIAEIVMNTLNVPFPIEPCPISLSEVDNECTFREMEFFLKNESIKGSVPADYLKGFIDCVFAIGGRYYIIDWKTNWLGPQYDDYAPQNVKYAMEQHQYYLQASIYTHALCQYLQVIDKRPIHECFGGALYLFVRGINSKSSGQGVLLLV